MDDRLSPLAARIVAGLIYTIGLINLLDLTGLNDLPVPAAFGLFVLNAMLLVRWLAHLGADRSTSDR